MTRALPITFNSHAIRAILDGRKTQTRLLLEPQPGPGQEARMYRTDQIDWQIYNKFGHPLSSEKLPYRLGDHLWVRETWAVDGPLDEARAAHEDMLAGGPSFGPYYRATEIAPDTLNWRIPKSMPRWASRLTLEVTDVRVQRLKEISAQDANAEGITLGALHTDQRDAFRELWNLTHSLGARWDDNPWVCVISFKVLPQ